MNSFNQNTSAHLLHKLAKTLSIFMLFALTSINTSIAQELKLSTEKHSGYYMVQGSKFNAFLIKETKLFADYKSVIMEPLSFENLTIKKTGTRSIDKSWKFTEQYIESLQEKFQHKSVELFSSDAEFSISNSNNEKSLSIQFFITEFLPTAELHPVHIDGSRDQLRKLGDVKFRIVIKENSSKELISIMDGSSPIKTKQVINNDQIGHITAWNYNFDTWLSYLLETFVDLKNMK